MTITQTSRRLALVAVAAVIAALLPLGGALAQDQDGEQDITLQLQGTTNTEYAIAWAQQSYPNAVVDAGDGPTRAFVGRDDLFADNLASGALQDEGPLLLTDSDTLSPETAAELARLGVTDVTILGGEDAVSSDVADALEDAGFTVDRLEGETRIETAIATAQENGGDIALLARGFAADDPTQAFADSLAAGAWAAEAGADILLTQTDVLTGNTADQLEAGGYDEVIIIGGESAISSDVEAEVAAINANVRRVAGDTRFDTAVAIADERGFGDSSDAAVTIVVDGQGEDAWADGFSAANIAGINNFPIVLGNSASGELPQATVDFLVPDGTEFANAHLTEVDGMCGSTLTDDECDEVSDLLDTTVEEAALIVPGATTVDPDSLAAGGDVTVTIPNAQPGDEIVISGCGVSETVTVSDDHEGDAVLTVTIPTSQAPGECELSVTVNGEEQGPFTVTVGTPAGNADTNTRPELLRAQIGNLVTPAQATASNPAGLRVHFFFDEPLTSVSGGFWSVYNSAQNPGAGFFAGTVTIDPANNRQATFNFTGITTQAMVDALTLATVSPGAVNDFQGLTNPDGDAPIGTASSTPGGAPGIAASPNLLSSTNFREGTTPGVTAVDFNFDKNAHVTGMGAFQLIHNNGANGSVITCRPPVVGSSNASGTAVPGGNGTMTITVLCDETNPPTNLTSETFSRAVVLQNTVTSTAGGMNPNPLQAADNANGGNTLTSDLVAAAFQPESMANADQVLFQLDQNPPGLGAPNLFGVYDNNGAEFFANMVTVNGNVVTATFADNVLANAVGANMRQGAVTGGQSDEVGVQNDFVTMRTPGVVAGPQLIDFNIIEQPTPFPPGPTVAQYIFSKDVAPAVTSGGFNFFLQDGTMFTAAGGSCARGGSEDTDHIVTCTNFAPAVTAQTMQQAVLGTVNFGSVAGEANALPNPEQGEAV